MNTKLLAVCHSAARLMGLFVTAGLVSDQLGTQALLIKIADTA